MLQTPSGFRSEIAGFRRPLRSLSARAAWPLRPAQPPGEGDVEVLQELAAVRRSPIGDGWPALLVVREGLAAKFRHWAEFGRPGLPWAGSGAGGSRVSPGGLWEVPDGSRSIAPDLDRSVIVEPKQAESRGPASRPIQDLDRNRRGTAGREGVELLHGAREKWPRSIPSGRGDAAVHTLTRASQQV